MATITQKVIPFIKNHKVLIGVLCACVVVISSIAFFVARQQNVSAVSYTASTEDFANPERGFFANYITTDVGTPITASFLQDVRTKNMTLVRRIYVIPGFRDAQLSQSFLDLVQADMNTARVNGVKYIVRFAYNFEGGGKDATQTRILEHIGQLKPLLNSNADVIAQMEAGFIGEWGEWHDSSNGLVNNAAMGAITNALLDALPKDRTIELRYNYHKRALFGNDPLTSQEAFTGTNKSRVGHHNDCFLASADDWGTYWDSMPIEQQKDYLHQENQFVPQSGETCNNDSKYVSCNNAQADLRRMRWSSINRDYEPNVIAGWGKGGCLPDIQKQLGYRLRLESANIQDKVKPGGSFVLLLTMANDGYASPYNPRKVEIILRNKVTKAEYFAAINDDPRTWQGGEQRQLAITAGVPRGLPEGDYEVFLSLPDPQANLYNKPQYSIRLANTGIWEAASGYNSLSKTIAVSSSAGGDDYTGSITFRPRNGAVLSPEPSTNTDVWSKSQAVPGKIEAENYKNGGEGTGYHDTDNTNQLHEYRQDGVDIEKTGDTDAGYDVGWTAPGEWLAYDVAVAKTASYTFSVRAGAMANTTKLHLEVDGADVTGPITLQPTGAWQTYKVTTSKAFNLTAGNHTFKVVLDTGEQTLNYFIVSEQQTAPDPTPTTPNPAGSGSVPSISRWSGTNDATYAQYSFSYTGGPRYYHVFIDADNNTATGYQIGGVGADYMLENSNAYRYTGNGGWGWAQVTSIGFAATAGNASWTVPRTAIGAASAGAVTVVFQTNDANGSPLATSPVYVHNLVQASGAITQYWAENNASNITYHATISPSYSFNHVYIDSDEQASTGYAIGGIGANYMIENDTLYRYSGNGGWGWTAIGGANRTVLGAAMTWTVSRVAIGAAATGQNRIVFNVTGGGPEVTTGVYIHVFAN